MQLIPIAFMMQNEQSAVLRCVNNGKGKKGQKGAEQVIGSTMLCE
jgi:hypothetical protein